MENGHGGKACMENGGIRPEAKVTTVLVRSKNTAIAAAVNTETPMSNKTPAMRDFLNMVSIIAMETPSPCVRSTHLLRERVVPYGDPNDPHYRKNAFDAGEDGLGKNAHFLKKVKNITRFK